jgi:hypothetical protein
MCYRSISLSNHSNFDVLEHDRQACESRYLLNENYSTCLKISKSLIYTLNKGIKAGRSAKNSKGDCKKLHIETCNLSGRISVLLSLICERKVAFGRMH